MSVTVQWDNELHTVMRYDFGGRWTWDEFFQAYATAKTQMATVSHTVHFILNPLDEIAGGYVPPGALTHVISIYRNTLPNTGMTVNVGAKRSFARSLMDIIGRVAPRVEKHFTYANSLEEARAFLAAKTTAKVD